MHFTTTLITTLAALTTFASAQTTPALPNPTFLTPNSNAAPGPAIDGYSYAGCWNETTGYTAAGGVRALAGGSMIANSTTTSSLCLDWCSQHRYQYCGIEYGRECWGSGNLNSYSTQLNESRCDYECVGNSSQVCGGSLALTLYNLTSSKTSAASTVGAPGEMVWALGSAVLVAGMSAVFIGL
ncbi:hypothetical protein MBLNU457_7294t1 [Dothideomycetes sp. NU457]